MEGDRGDYDHPLLFGVRVSARPLDGLEISLERTAQFCGEGRSCTWSDFWNLWWGNDNAGENVDAEDEPGNQLAGWDIRWASPIGDWNYALYNQHTGETIDNQISAPYRSMDTRRCRGLGRPRVRRQLAAATSSGPTRAAAARRTSRSSGTAPTTTASSTSKATATRVACIGHSMDGDGVQYAAALPADAGERLVRGDFMVRYSQLNRGGSFPDTQQLRGAGSGELVELRRVVPPAGHKGWIEVGVGLDQEDRKWDDDTALLPRGTITWHRGF